MSSWAATCAPTRPASDWLRYGVLDDWDFWGGTFGLVLVAVIETMIFMWIFKPENAWRSIHQGADIQIPRIFKFVIGHRGWVAGKQHF